MKIIYFTTLSSTINAFFKEHIKMLRSNNYIVDIATNITRELDDEVLNNTRNIYNIDFSRNPLSKSNLIAYKRVREILTKNQYDIIHTHTPVASFIARLAAINTSAKVIYTAHGFHFFNGASKKNWLIYYPLEMILVPFTDLLITINQEDFKRGKRMGYKNVKLIPGVGFNYCKFSSNNISTDKLKKNLNIPKNSFIILSVGELNNNKNHMTILRAVAELKDTEVHYVICGTGPNDTKLRKEAQILGLENHLHLLGYKSNVSEIYPLADIFAFPSLREGLGMAAIEAMAAGLPIITSNIHGINDYSINGKTGYKFRPLDIQGFSSGIKKLKDNPNLRNKMGSFNKKIAKKYDISQVLPILEKMYIHIEKEDFYFKD